MPVVVSLLLWADFVSCAPLVHYIDNESSRMAFIKGYGGIILRADGTFSLDNQTRPGGLVC